jgi:ribosomal protein L12E/L44/L45/RPP1/RPP2
MFSIVYLPYYKGEVKKEKSMRGIPVEHARWVGSLLSQLTDKQLSDAFVAAKYKSAIANAFVRALRERINQLNRL